MDNFEGFSRLYAYVRGRQLEGTFPGDSITGTWPVTACRVSKGWGAVKESAFPYNLGKPWPPMEPAGLDDLAKEFRIKDYQRVRTLEECKLALSCEIPVMLSLNITDQWYNAVNGLITMPSSSNDITGAHSITIVGYNNDVSQLIFRNSWGTGWGDKGHGYLPYQYFEDYLTESWIYISTDDNIIDNLKSGIRIYNWGILSPLNKLFHAIEMYDHDTDNYVGWAFAVEREGYLDVEEFFICPNYRAKSKAKTLLDDLTNLSQKLNLPLRFWIPFADSNVNVITHLLSKIGLSIVPSEVQWALLKGI